MMVMLYALPEPTPCCNFCHIKFISDNAKKSHEVTHPVSGKLTCQMCEMEVEDLEEHRKNCGPDRIKHAKGEKEADMLFLHSTMKSKSEDVLNLRSEILKPRNLYHPITINRNEQLVEEQTYKTNIQMWTCD